MNADQLNKLLPYVELDRDASARYAGMTNEDVFADLVANGIDPMEYATAQAKARMAVQGCLLDLEKEFGEHPMEEFKRQARRKTPPQMPGLPALLNELFSSMPAEEEPEPPTEEGEQSNGN